MNESNKESVAMLRELADGIESEKIVLLYASKSENHGRVRVQNNSTSTVQFMFNGDVECELVLKYHR